MRRRDLNTRVAWTSTLRGVLQVSVVPQKDDIARRSLLCRIPVCLLDGEASNIEIEHSLLKEIFRRLSVVQMGTDLDTFVLSKAGVLSKDDQFSLR